MHTATGLRRLKFGETYKIAGRNAGLKAELDRLLGRAKAPEPEVDPELEPDPATASAEAESAIVAA
jgi:hypothetical protein